MTMKSIGWMIHIKQCLTENLKTIRDDLVINNIFSHKVECGNELG